VGRQDLIDKARRNRKMLGGGMRQSGILAAAGLYALEHNIPRLADDHARAKRLAEGLARHSQLQVTIPDTNIVFVDMDAELERGLTAFLQARGFGMSGRYGQQRWVTHLDIGDDDIDAGLAAVDLFFS
jgi:threonine aldolase